MPHPLVAFHRAKTRSLVVASSLATMVLGCGQADPGVRESAPQLATSERSPAASQDLPSDAPSAVAYSVRRRLRDFTDDGAYDGETLDVWTCRRDESCTSEGHTDVLLAGGGRLRVEWRTDYDPRGNPIRIESKTTETGKPDEDDVYEFGDGTVRFVRRAPGEMVREFVLPADFRNCVTRCRELIVEGGGASDFCHTVYPDGPRRRDLAVRRVADPKLGPVWEQVVVKPETGAREARLVDASCQQLEAHIMASHSVLLSEERIGEPPVPAYGPEHRR